MDPPHTSPTIAALPGQGTPSAATHNPTLQKTRVDGTRSRRRKTFTGCWTCRSRHVKCDEQRPECRRCLAGSFACHGYGLRLTWVTDSGKVPTTGNRRTHSQRSWARDVQPEPDRSDTRLDVNHQSQGVFSVFEADTSNASHIPVGIDAITGERSWRTDNENGKHRYPAGSNDVLRAPMVHGTFLEQDLDFTEHSRILDDTTPAFTAPSPRNLIQGQPEPPERQSPTWTEFDNINAVDMGIEGSAFDDEAGFGETDPTLSWMSSSVFPGSETPSRISAGHEGQISTQAFRIHQVSFDHTGHPARMFDVLVPSVGQRDLINHWVMHLSHKLMPLRTPTNPFLTVLSPIALEGSRVAGNKSSSAVALFHAVCAASATHQAKLRGDSSDASALILQHRQLSYFHLMRNMHIAEPNERLASFGTLCLWIMTQFISGTPGTWREVVKVARKLLEQTRMELWTESASASVTYQSYVSSLALLQTRYVGYHEFPGRMEIDHAGHDFFKSLGLSTTLLGLISSFNSKMLSGRTMDAIELDQLEIEFALSTPPVASNTVPDDETQAGLQHHRSLFYHACLLYFRCASGRREPESDIDALVAACVEHIDKLDATTMDRNPSTWIYATVAFEARTANMRDRMRASLNQRKTLGFETWNVLLLAVEEIWKIRDETPSGRALEPWPHVLARLPQFDLLLF